jgi:hypothetical protein
MNEIKIYKLVITFIVFLFTFLPTTIIAQEEEEIIEEYAQLPKEEINITQLSSLLNSANNEIIISDYKIVDSKSDSSFVIDKIFFSYYEIKPITDKPKKIYFYNCDFELGDKTPLSLSGFNFSKLNIIGCNFYNPIELQYFNKTGDQPIIIENCEFHHDLTISSINSDNVRIEIKKNIFRSQILINCELDYLEITACSFNAGEKQFLDKDTEKQYFQLDVSEIKISNLHIEDNIFDNSGFENVFSINMYELETDNLYLYKNTMYVIDISYAEVGKSLLIDSLYVEKYIGIQNLDFPETNTNIPWYNLGDEKLSIFIEVENDILWAYQAKTDEQLSDNLLYNDLLSAYTKLNTLYHDRGDITSANASYVEIKDLETRRQAYIQSINPSLNNYINYNLNVFLKFFSDYATNPGKSLKLSLWAILIFTGLYMIFFSAWDKINFSFLVNQYNKFSLYISSDSKIHEVYYVKSDDELGYEKIKCKYLKSKKKVPGLLKLFGKFIFFIGNLKHIIIPNLLKLF